MESNINIENKISIPIKPLDIIFFKTATDMTMQNTFLKIIGWT